MIIKTHPHPSQEGNLFGTNHKPVAYPNEPATPEK
jgi:hypothetical protein